MQDAIPAIIDERPHASGRASRPIRLGLAMLCLLWAFAFMSVAKAHAPNTVVWGSDLSPWGDNNHWVFDLATGEASEQGVIDAGYPYPPPICKPGPWRNSPANSNYWDPANAPNPGANAQMAYEISQGTACLAYTEYPYLVGFVTQFYCGSGYHWIYQYGDCETGWYLYGPRKPVHRGKGCNCSTGDASTGDPIGVGTGNMYRRETDFVSADPRLQYSRSYNSNSTTISPVGIGWLGSNDAHIVDITELDYPQPLEPDNSAIYGDPQDACTSGFAALAAADPTVYAGIYVKYVPDQTGLGAGTCQEFNAYGVQFGYLPILNTAQTYAEAGSPVRINVGYGAVRDDGSQYAFYCTQGTCAPDSPSPLQLSVDASGNFTLIDADGVSERYDSYGMLLTRTWKDGYQLTFAHNGNGKTSGDGTLQSIVDNHGRKIALGYDSYGKLSTLNAPDGTTITYNLDPHGRLTSVTNPTGTRTYQYTNASFPNALTGIVDENSATNGGNPYTTWTYDANGLANGSADAGGVNSVAIVHNTDGSASVTDPFGTQRNYTFQTQFGFPQVTSISGPVCFDCNAGAVSTYDKYGYLASSTDWKGVVTGYTFVAGLLNQRIDAENTTAQRTTTTFWDPILRNPTDTTVADTSNNGNVLKRKIDWQYNASGEPLARCEEDPSVPAALSYAPCSNTGTVPAGVRRWTYAYCALGDSCPLIGLLKTVTDPLGHITTYLYYASDDSSCAGAPTTCPHRVGDLQSVTNARNQTTSYTRYDGAGRLLSMIDANQVETDFQYGPRGWPTQIAVRATNGTTGPGDEVTGISYYNDGDVQRITRPDGSYANFSYDAAHRLTDIADNLGDAIHYTLNTMGERTEDDTRDPSSALKHSIVRQFNALGELANTFNAGGTAVNGTYTYDASGNPHLTTDGRGYVTDQSFDPLNRLASTVEDEKAGDSTHANASIQTTYDALDHLHQVTDPQGLPTTYNYDGLNDLVQLISPDTGTTTSTYDAAGNLKTRTDARSVTATYAYDALNRVSSITYPTTALNVTITYDTTMPACNQTTQVFSIGHVTQIQDGSGATRFCYDRFGNVGMKVQVVNGTNFTTNYAYDLGNHLIQETTPFGTIFKYTRDALSRITKVTYRLNGRNTDNTVVSNVSYYPYGPVASITYGDGRVLNRTYDQDYVISGVTDSASSGLNLTFGRDVMGNLTQINTGTNSGNILSYDGLNRLTTVTDLANTQIAAYTYDGTGNRMTKQGGTGSPLSLYSYPTNSHQLQATGPAGSPVPRDYDADGNTTSIGTGSGSLGFVFDNTGRMNQVNNSAGAAQMQYATNTLGERVEKYLTGNSALTQFTVYDEAGHPIGDYDSNAKRIRETVWMDGMPIAVIGGTSTVSVTYLEPDQIGTPRVGIDGTSNAATWNWSPLNDPFGETQPTGALTLNLRMPGQVYDAESGLNYNYFRDYDSTTGRYTESDPNGLKGGISTYVYVAGRPTGSIDTYGLSTVQIGGAYSVGGSLFGVSGSQTGGAGIAIDSQGNIGIYGTLGVAKGAGDAEMVGASVKISGENTINDLNGDEGGVSETVAAGDAASVEVTNESVQLTVGEGWGGGAVEATASNTVVIPLGNINDLNSLASYIPGSDLIADEIRILSSIPSARCSVLGNIFGGNPLVYEKMHSGGEEDGR